MDERAVRAETQVKALTQQLKDADGRRAEDVARMDGLFERLIAMTGAPPKQKSVSDAEASTMS